MLNPLPQDIVQTIRDLLERVRRLELRSSGDGAGSAIEDPRTFFFQGPLTTINGVDLTPHKETITGDHTATITAFGQTGPADGTCDVYWYVNATNIDETDLPYVLSDGDKIRPFLDASDDAATLSAHFTIVRT